MQIDWFTLVAEIVNFLILVFLLKKLLYDRILAIAERREQQIASRYDEAQALQQEAAEDAASLEEERKSIEGRRDSLLQEARNEASEKRDELIREARSAVESQQEEWYVALAREQERFLRDLHHYTGEQVYKVTRRALEDLANAQLEQQVVQVFLERLHELTDEETEDFRAMLAQKEAEVRSTYPLPQASQEKITETLRSELGVDLSPRFKVDEELLCGIALRIDGRRVAWNVEDYLDHLQHEARQKLEETFQSQIAEEARHKSAAEENHSKPEEPGELEEKIEQKVRAVLAERTTESAREGEQGEEDKRT